MSERHEFEFEIAAAPEQVWRALVDPDALRGWFASDARVTPQVGGEWYVAHGEYDESSTIDELVPNERLVTSHDGKGVAFILEGRAGTTVLRIVHSGFSPEPPTLESLERGWVTYMQTLGHYLASHADEPAAATYVYARGGTTLDGTRRALPAMLPGDADVFDDSPRSLGARVPELGDGIFRASVEGHDGHVFVWVHLVAYGAGRDRLPALVEDVKERLATAFGDATSRGRGADARTSA